MKYLVGLLLLLNGLYASAQTDTSYLPHGDNVIYHRHYILDYNERHEQANWVVYYLEASESNGTAPRSDIFRPDPMVSTGSAALGDYKGSGYDRGHLAPAGDMAFSWVAMSESFFMSNMSPQTPALNRGKWKSLESKVREWAGKKYGVYVITGPVFQNNQGSIGPNRVTVPGYYYKIIFNPSDTTVVSFLMPNRKLEKGIFEYAVSVDQVEAMTGIDFLWQLPDDIENKIESGVSLNKWTTETGRLTTSVRCKGIAASTGQRCKLRTKNANGYCHLHQSQVNNPVQPSIKSTYSSSGTRCRAITKAGTRCKRKATSNGYCWQHAR